MKCEQCRRLEQQIAALWSALFPHETWIDAESALRYLEAEFRSLVEIAHSRLDTLEQQTRQNYKDLTAQLGECVEEAERLRLLGDFIKGFVDPESVGGKIRARLRNPVDIQRAHDTLHVAIADSMVRAALFVGDHKGFHAICASEDVLCWVLGHEHNDTFEKNLAHIDETLASLGLVLEDTGELRKPGGNPNV